MFSEAHDDDVVEVRDAQSRLLLHARARTLLGTPRGEPEMRVPAGTYSVAILRDGRVVFERSQVAAR